MHCIVNAIAILQTFIIAKAHSYCYNLVEVPLAHFEVLDARNAGMLEITPHY